MPPLFLLIVPQVYHWVKDETSLVLYATIQRWLATACVLALLKNLDDNEGRTRWRGGNSDDVDKHGIFRRVEFIFPSNRIEIYDHSLRSFSFNFTSSHFLLNVFVLAPVDVCPGDGNGFKLLALVLEFSQGNRSSSCAKIHFLHVCTLHFSSLFSSVL